MGPAGGIAHVVGDQHYRASGFALPRSEQLKEAFFVKSVDVAKGLVEQKYPRSTQECPPNGQALLLSAREAVGGTRRIHSKAQGAHHAAHQSVFFAVKFAQHEVEQVVAHATVGRKSEILLDPHHPGMPGDQAIPRMRVPPHPNIARVGKNLAGEQRKQRGLA